MTTDHRAALQKIRTFPSLVRYLRDEMGWPIGMADFEDLMFDYTPEELGIDAKNAAKIEEIKRLRPLSVGQPWGIFFVKFEPKRLPVLALRRILSQVALKKRSSANSAERTAWAADDLLFVSNYGEGDTRQITFAHFSQGDGEHDLPTLKVLGWDNLDTPLHLEDVADKLTHDLAWPDDADDVDAWRQAWSSAFTLQYREVITTSRDLSIRLAQLARTIRDRIRAALAIETETGQLTKLLHAFRKALIHDLTADDFADMYAQTIAYGLLTARIAHPNGTSTADLHAQMPVTNPFLKELMETFLREGGGSGVVGGPTIDFDELGVSEVVDLLDDANMEAVIRDFGDRNPEEDPVIHFYELFLKEYDFKQKLQRGVFYTPRPVVSYIVRSVDQLLRSEIGLRHGLADTTSWGEMVKRDSRFTLPDGIDSSQAFVQILDPATGTGTFLVEVIDVIHREMTGKWREEGINDSQIEVLWNAYVPTHLLPRLHGFELLMAPYAIAHLKVGLKLYETGYRFGSNERARIYLTNSLEPPYNSAGQFEFAIPALANEAQAVDEVKRNQHFTVIIGNPPYAGHSRNNDIGWIVDKVKDFTRDDPSLRRPGQGKWLQDDYVKFLRLGQFFLSSSVFGILAMITNHRYLTNRTFKGLRRQWVKEFSTIRALDLHGNRVVHEVSPLGDDENVFDIEQGVAIGIFVKQPVQPSSVAYAELWGPRRSPESTGKYDVLAVGTVATTAWKELSPNQPDWFFAPRAAISNELQREFDDALSMSALMPGALGPNGKPQSGIATMHDSFAVSFSVEELELKIRKFLESSDREDAKAIFGTLCNPQQWNYDDAKRSLADGSWREKISKIWFAPFDIRYTVYDRAVAVHLRRRLSDHLFNHDNLALVIGESGKEISGDEWDAVCCVNGLLQLNYFRRNGSPTFPLYLFEKGRLADGLDEPPRPNLSPQSLSILAERLQLPVSEDGLPEGVTPRDFFHYIYATLYSPSYRTRYAVFLKMEFPRVVLPSHVELFRALASIGSELVALHVMESSALDRVATTYSGPNTPLIERVHWSDDTVWLDAPDTRKGQSGAPGTIGFRRVPAEVWSFHIGGYQVCEKWLKDRKGRTLSTEDIAHYEKIVVALCETIRLMQEIDDVIEEYGGWPGAFRTAKRTS